MTNTNAGKDINMEDKKAFETAYKDNTPYWKAAPDKILLRNFVSYYESCKAAEQKAVPGDDNGN